MRLVENKYNKFFITRCILISIFLITFSLSASSQESLKREKWVKFTPNKFLIDSLTIWQPSLKIIDTKPSIEKINTKIKIEYNINSDSAQFNVLEKENTLLLDSVLLSYRVFPFNLSAEKYNRSQALYDSGKYYKPKDFDENLNSDFESFQSEEIISIEGIEKTGSLSRGVNFGNAQSLGVNSSLNLLLSGKLSEDVEISAAITDRQLPFQPEGNTQQIQDLDRVLIQLKHKNAVLSAGDITLQNDPSHFLRFYKNVQGGQLSVFLGDTVTQKSTTKVGVSVARGQFYSQRLEAIEGVNGPYRLQGPNNERFIIVIANSEKVFLDGEELTRGFMDDYVIDYNNAEVTFTSNVVITKFSRIRVDFEYANQEYARSILQASHHKQLGRGNIYANFYREKDNKNKPLLREISQEEKAILANIGDDLGVVSSFAVDTLNEFSPSRILYTTKDTLVENVVYTIFARATIEDSLLLNIPFIEVGEGNGDYTLSTTASNGRVHQWVAPANGMSQGNYSPGRLVKAPNQRMMATLGGGFYLGKKNKISWEGAYSLQDQNLFSREDDKDNKGYAFKWQLDRVGDTLHWMGDYAVNWMTSIEYDQQNFRGIDRFRSIDFDRDWVLDYQNLGDNSDLIFQAGIDLKRDPERNFSYHFTKRKRGDLTNGEQHNLVLNQRWKFASLKGKLFLLNTNQGENYSKWLKGSVRVEQLGKTVIPGYYFDIDQHAQYRVANDSAINTLMNYEAHTFYIRNGDSTKVNYKLQYQWRNDETPIDGELKPNNKSEFARLDLGYNSKRNQIQTIVNFRSLENLQSANNDKEETLSGRMVWNFSLPKNILRSNLTYEIQSSRELRKEFVYFEVFDGSGTHTWRDDNEDGIQDLNEFYLAVNPDERDFVKYFVPTDDYINAFNKQLEYRFSWNTPFDWKNKSGFKKVLSLFSLSSSLRYQQKITENDLKARLIPFYDNINEESVISENVSQRHNLFINRGSINWESNFSYQKIEGKQLLVAGFQSRDQESFNYFFRWNMKEFLSMTVDLGLKEIKEGSDFLEDRNFMVEERKVNPILIFQPSSNIRIEGSYNLSLKNGESISETQKSDLHTINLGFRLSKSIQRSIEGDFSFIQVNHDGELNTPLSYQMLDALQPGKNFNIRFQLLQKITKGLQLSASYNGRKPPTSPIIHTGNVRVTALF